MTTRHITTLAAALIVLCLPAMVSAAPVTIAPGTGIRPELLKIAVEPQIYVLDQYNPGYITRFTGIEAKNYIKTTGDLANQAIWVDRDGWIYIARYYGQTGNRIERYAPAGGPPISYAVGLKRPTGVAVDSKGRIYIADADLCQIIRIDNIAGDNRVALGRPGSYLGEFKNPCGVFIDSKDRIYIADTGNHRIVRVDDMGGNGWYAYNGMQYGSVGGQVAYPWTLWVDNQDRIYYLRPDRSAICRVDDMTGKNYVSYGVPSVSPPYPREKWLGRPEGVAVDREGRIYIADQDNRWVVRIDDMTGANRVELFQVNGQPAFRRPTRIFVAYPKAAPPAKIR